MNIGQTLVRSASLMAGGVTAEFFQKTLKEKILPNSSNLTVSLVSLGAGIVAHAAISGKKKKSGNDDFLKGIVDGWIAGSGVTLVRTAFPNFRMSTIEGIGNESDGFFPHTEYDFVEDDTEIEGIREELGQEILAGDLNETI